MTSSVNPSKPLVYAGMVADGLHHGHVHMVLKAAELGDLIVGVLTDEAVKSYKREPIMSWEERKFVVENLKGVSQVVPQETLDYVPNILKYRPRFLVHGDDWNKPNSPQYEIRKEVIAALASVGGELVEVGYTPGISTTDYYKRIIERFQTP
jgi:phosphoenolpyruvate phosphomutase / 2-hydroxyethylphosphonate cytidylyltransferase